MVYAKNTELETITTMLEIKWRKTRLTNEFNSTYANPLHANAPRPTPIEMNRTLRVGSRR